MIATALTQKGTPTHTKRLNVHFARMGEPSWNEEVLYCARWIFEKLYDKYNPHPVVSTMMPKKNRFLKSFIDKWMLIKNEFYCGNAGLQLSINSTDEGERRSMFGGNAHTLESISKIMDGIKPIGRKITLNFAVADYTVDCVRLARLFSPDNFIIKLTPMHKTHKAICNNIETCGEYTSPEPYQELESRMQKSGFETLVFIASKDEDDSLITCGNAVLSGSKPKCKHSHEIFGI
jgi:23S rRNA (adenine2503-C2)-methyltransferase